MRLPKSMSEGFEYIRNDLVAVPLKELGNLQMTLLLLVASDCSSTTLFAFSSILLSTYCTILL